MEWMEGLGPFFKVGFAIIAVFVAMFVARLLFHREPDVK